MTGNHNLSCWPQGPGDVQVMDGRHFSANHLLSRANDMLQSALVLGSGSSLLGGDEGGENGLSDGGLEILCYY